MKQHLIKLDYIEFIAHWNRDLVAKVMKIYDIADRDVKASCIWRNYSGYLKFNILFCMMQYITEM